MKKIIIFVIFLFFLGFIPAACGAGYVVKQIFSGDYSKFDKSKILEILSKETILFYSDGNSQLGSLFGQEHRIYVPIDKIPTIMKSAIVSAEDEDFYTNIGIDPKGIFRAAIHNILFHSRQGASTITQQTVKNLYGRKETDLFTKFEEMIDAFKMERIYSKDQILEFYLNQFHVTGNGRGVGVAAKYYFNKEVENLDLVESAFIAGSVKGPEKYNPFTKTTETSQLHAKQQAMFRKNYVIERMYKDKKITQQQYLEALKLPVPFNQGRFQYNELSINKIVMKQLSRAEILQAINATNEDEIGTMGLHITTTLDKNIQNAAQYGLRQNLSRMQMRLKGFETEPAENFTRIQKPELNGFYVGHIDSINSTPNNEYIRLNFGVPTCLVNTDSINRVAINIDQVMKRGLEKSKDYFLKSLTPGQYVLVSIKKIESDGITTCDLETRPKIQGAALVLDKGKIIAMAGGFSSNQYNRALFAERQPGSTFKLPTYYAALQLGWSVLDSIPNIRDVFSWQGIFYFPSPDHAPDSLETTILGAGSTSQNLASVWLLSHLLDKINYNQFQDLLKFLGIIKEGMSSADSISLIADKFNATPDNELYLKEGILNNIKNDYMTDLNIINNNSLKIFIRTLHYGSDFEKPFQEILANKTLNEKEQKIRINILKNSLVHWNSVASQVENAVHILSKIQNENTPITESEREALAPFARLTNSTDAIAFISANAWQPQIGSRFASTADFYPESLENLLTLVKTNPEILNPAHILLDGVVPLSMVQSISENLNNTLQQVKAKPALERLFWNADFRYSLAMYYTAKMVSSMGVSEPPQWVPSFPLGSNVVTLAELALMYQTFLNGKIYRYFNTAQTNQLLVIKRIEDSLGNLLWESKAKEYTFADSFYSAPILNTARGTVTAGTAHILNSSIILRSNNPDIDKKLLAEKIRVPTFGKTGTTNNFTNGTYIGFLPYPAYQGDILSPNNAYTIASYIGFDSNEPMVRKWYHAYGGEAIPAWEEIALDIIKNQNYAEKLNWEELSKNQSHLVNFNYGSNLSQVVVPINSGVSIAVQAPEDEDAEGEENNIYANDYTQTRRHVFSVYLEGSSSDNIFIPKRKVSFYSPYIDKKMSSQVEEESGKNGEPASPLPLIKNSSKELKDEILPTEEEKENTKEGKEKFSITDVKNFNPQDDLPPPPPSLVK